VVGDIAIALRIVSQAAHCRAAVRRSNGCAKVLYTNNWRETLTLCAKPNPIAVPGGGPAMRGGPTALDSARGKRPLRPAKQPVTNIYPSQSNA